MPRPKNLAPVLCQHKDGRYYVRTNGRFHSLGRDLDAARQRLGALLAGARRDTNYPLITHKVPTVGAVLAAWLLERGPRVDARQRARMAEAVRACAPWADDKASEFRQRHLKAARALLLARPSRRGKSREDHAKQSSGDLPVIGNHAKLLSRNYVNCIIGLVQTCWRWAASEDMVSAEERDAVCALLPLGRGEGGAEVARRQPAPPNDVKAALEHMGCVPAAMVRLQLLTGMRPGEVCGLSPAEVDRTGFTFDGAVWWIYAPGQHKTAHLGKARLVVLGPLAQTVLLPYLDRPPGSPCFSPLETTRPGNARSSGYSVESYCQAVGYACAAAGMPPWTPHMLRHLASTTARDGGASREDTAALLGHAQVETTDAYTHALLQAAARAAKNLS